MCFSMLFWDEGIKKLYINCEEYFFLLINFKVLINNMFFIIKG